MGAGNLAIKFPLFLVHLLLRLIFFMSSLTCVGMGVEGGMLGATLNNIIELCFVVSSNHIGVVSRMLQLKPSKKSNFLRER